MFSCDESIRGSFKRVGIDDVLDSLIDTIEALPQRRDARSDPIFEPHFKLVSIVHKLVHSGTLAVTIDSTFIRSMNFADSSLACRGKQDSPSHPVGSEGPGTRRHYRMEVVYTRSSEELEECGQVKLASSDGRSDGPYCIR
jgi:hypothetical protein